MRGSWIESACLLLTEKMEPEQRQPALHEEGLHNVVLSMGYDKIVRASKLWLIIGVRTR